MQTFAVHCKNVHENRHSSNMYFRVFDMLPHVCTSLGCLKNSDTICPYDHLQDL